MGSTAGVGAGMQTVRWGLAVASTLLLLLTACGNADREPRLMNLRTSADGPDEFAIVPPKPLANPADLTALPEPTPGGSNLTDPNPQADAIVALGGRVPAAAGGIPTTDAAMTSYAARRGRSTDIRTTLAVEDLQFRQTNRGRLLERVFRITTYYQVYAEFALSAYDELARWRAAGVATPSAPPPNP